MSKFLIFISFAICIINFNADLAFSVINFDRDVLEQNAINGDQESQIELGNIYFEKKLYDHAKLWYEKAAMNGNSVAQNKLGNIYHEGLGVDKDLYKSKYFYELSAKNGNKFAQYNLGNSYYHGEGCDKDIDEALKWINLSCNSGYKKACETLNYISKKENKNTNKKVITTKNDELKFASTNSKNLNNNQEVASKKTAPLKNSNNICKFFMDITILQNAEYNKQYNKNYNKDKNIKIYNPKEIIDIIYGYYGEPSLGDSNEYHNKIGNDYHNCMIKNGLKPYYTAGIPSSLYVDDIDRYENPLQNIYDIMNEYEYIKSEQIRKDEEKRKEEERIKRLEEQRLAQIEMKKREKEILKKGCLKILADYNISEEEYDYLIPFSNTFGELLCYGKMGEVINSFSKPNMFNNYYTVDYEFMNGAKIKLKFKKEENTLFEKQAHRRLETDKPVLNFEVYGDGETLKPKSFDESMMIFINIAQPLIANGMINIRDFAEYFK